MMTSFTAYKRLCLPLSLCLSVSNLSFDWQGRMRVSAVSRALPGVCLNRIILSRNHLILGGSSVSACQPHFRLVSMTKCLPKRKTRKHSQPHVNSSASFSIWAYLCSVCLSVSVMRTRLVSTASPLSVGGLYWICMKRHLHHGFISLLGSSTVSTGGDVRSSLSQSNAFYSLHPQANW